MADEVEITNVGNGGTVASEETLAKLVSAVEKLAAKSGGSGSGNKVQALYNQTLAKGTSETKKNTSADKANTQATKESTESINAMKIALGGLLTGLGQLSGSAINLANELFQGGDQITDFAKHIPLIGDKLSILTGFIDNSVSSFRDLSSVGGAFSGGITQMLQTAVDLELNLGELASVVQSNSQSLRFLGGTVQGGVERFAAINKNLKASGDFSQLKNLGFTVEEVNEGIADYGALQSRLGRLQGQNNTQLAEGAAGYLTQLDKLSRVTGKSRKELESQMASRAQDAGFRALMNQFAEGSEEAENFTTSMALIDTLPADVATGLKDLADGVPQTVEGQQLLAAAGPEVLEAMKAIGQGADPQVLINALASAGGELEGFAGLRGTERAAFIANLRETNPVLAGLLDSATAMTQLSTAELNSATAEQEKLKAEEQSLLTFDDKIKSIRAKLAQAFLDSGVLDLIITGLEGFANLLTGFGEGLAATMDLINEGKWFEAITTALGAALSGLWENKGIIAAIVGGIGALMAAKAVVSGIAGAASRGIESKLSNIFGGGGSPGASTPRARAPAAGRAVGRNAAAAGGGIGKGLGNLGGGILKGIAGGLKAFANPQVAIGAAVVAGVILVIGGAIAGAAWLLGKSLPTLVDGIKSFETIDGANLKSAAVGMLALSGAMAAFGAGSAVAGLGSMVGGITGAIGKLFGADDPLEQLKQFAAADIDAEKVKSNAEAMAAFSAAMAAGAAGGAAEGLGSVVSGIAGGIGALFGGSDTDDIVADMVKFAAVDVDTAKVKNNAEAMIAFSGAMAASAGGNAVSGLGTLVSGIAGGIGALFGGDTTEDTFEQLKKFASYDIDSAKVKNNAEAMSAFSAAMATGAAGTGASAVASIGSAIASFFGGDTPLDQVKEFGEMKLNVAQIEANANAIKSMSTSLNGFSETDLDDTPIISYTEAIEKLTEALGKMNEELSRDNDTLMTSRADAGELLSGISASSSGTAQGTNQLNSTMQAMLATLVDLKDINTKVERNTKAITSGNIADGYVSRT